MDRVYLVNKTNKTINPGGYHDAEEAYRMLRAAAQEHDNLQHFRDVWLQQGQGGGSFPPSDASLLHFLAERLADGILAVAGRQRPEPDAPRRRNLGGTAAPPPPSASEPPTPPSEAPLKLRPRVPTLPPEITKALVDAAEQAQCLLDAARDALPFCEQCAKD